jgi:hypothetical protein
MGAALKERNILMVWTEQQVAQGSPELAAQLNDAKRLARNDPLVDSARGMPHNERWVTTTYTGTIPPIPAKVKTVAGLGLGALVVAVVWIILGMIAQLLSILCFFKSGGTTSQNIGGFLLAFFLGPFYFFYRAWGPPNYCKNVVAPLPQA